MRFLRAAAVAATLVSGWLGLSGAVVASPLVAGTMPAAKASAGPVTQAQYYVERRVYRPRTAVRVFPAYRPRTVVRTSTVYRSRRILQTYPYRVYRPRPVVRYYPAYRPVRTVCRTRVRIVQTAYGYVRRPVRICTRRY